MSAENRKLTVTLRREFHAPIELVFRAWTEAEHVAQWMKCDAAAKLELDNWVPAVGTRFRTHMSLEGVFEAHGSGEFITVDPPHLLEYKLHADEALNVPEMQVRVEFREQDGRTELTLTHSGIPSDQMCGIIEGGWTNSLGMLGERLKNQAEGASA